MRSIAVMNQKGGVGKTTSSVNLAAALAREGRRVCLMDLDPQGHASFHVGVEAGPDMPTVYDVFMQQTTLDHTRQLVGENLSLVPANIDLAATEVELAGVQGREFFLRNAMQHWKEQNRFDYVVMDCPPSLGVLTINALTAVNEVFIPLQPHFFALQGLSKLFETTALVTRRLNRDLRVTGIMMCLYESGTRLAADVTEDLKQFLTSSDGDTPWASARISGRKFAETSSWPKRRALASQSLTTLRRVQDLPTTSRWLRKFSRWKSQPREQVCLQRQWGHVLRKTS